MNCPVYRIACFGLAFKANIRDFAKACPQDRAKLARRYGGRVKCRTLIGQRATPQPFADTRWPRLIDIDQALENLARS